LDQLVLLELARCLRPLRKDTIDDDFHPLVFGRKVPLSERHLPSIDLGQSGCYGYMAIPS
jgi:hypothetical protein